MARNPSKYRPGADTSMPGIMLEREAGREKDEERVACPLLSSAKLNRTFGPKSV